jgi:glycosyltransferase involved in cell wall biosynthesis
MKILIVSFSFPPNKDGIAEAAWSMAVGYAQRGHQVVVATGHLPQRHDFTPHLSIRVGQFEIDAELLHQSHADDEVRRMKQFILESEPDIVICHCWPVWSTTVAEETFPHLKVPKILVSHGYPLLWNPQRKFPWGIRSFFRRLATTASFPRSLRSYDRVVFASRKRDWSRHLDYRIASVIRHPGIKIIPIGTDPEPARNSDREFRKAHQLGDKFMILCVSNYFPLKNQLLTLQSFRKARIPNSVLVFIGSDFNDYSRRLMELDRSLQTDQPGISVVFLEKLDRASTFAAFAACDVFLLTSTSETGPIVILEAMAAEKPFVTTDVGIVRELPGGIVADGEAEIAAALGRLHEDESLRYRLGKEGRAAILRDRSNQIIEETREELVRELERKSNLQAWPPTTTKPS